MKKIYILICILLCCGCSIRYEIKFEDNIIDDSLYLTYSKDEELFRSFVSEPLFAVDNLIYDLNENNKGDSVSLNYSYSFDTTQYSRAFIPSSCFSNYNFIRNELRVPRQKIMTTK